MKRMYAVALLALLGAALSGPVRAQEADDDDEGTCLYNDRAYATSVAVCQAGLVQLCVGGEWQTTGRFCDGVPDGQTLGIPELGPGQVTVDPGPPPVPDDDD